jgi:hypothetical protein
MKWVRAALPARARECRCDRVDEAGMRVGADKLDAGEAACDQAAHVGEPGGAVLAGDDVEAERLTETVPVDPDRVDDAGVDGAAAFTALHDQSVQGDVDVRSAIQRPGTEVLDDLVEALREPRDLTLAHPLDTELLHQLLDPPRGDTGEIGVGDH